MITSSILTWGNFAFISCSKMGQKWDNLTGTIWNILQHNCDFPCYNEIRQRCFFPPTSKSNNYRYLNKKEGMGILCEMNKHRVYTYSEGKSNHNANCTRISYGFFRNKLFCMRNEVDHLHEFRPTNVFHNDTARILWIKYLNC